MKITSFISTENHIVACFGSLVFEVFRERTTSGNWVTQHTHKIFIDKMDADTYVQAKVQELNLFKCSFKDAYSILEGSYWTEINTLVGFTLMTQKLLGEEEK